jgi:hypothetical protein
MSNQYLVAKYIESPTRLEPRNIGIFIRIGDSWRARFLGESVEGKLDLRRVRSVVSHTGSYQQWVEYWRHILQSTPANDMQKALESSSKVNFIVSEGTPVFLAADATAHPERILEYLYHLVVTEFPEQRAEELSLSQIVEDTIRKYNLRQNPHFADSPSVLCELPSGIVEHVKPNYGYINGREVYFQKVSINPYKPEAAQKEVHNAAWIFERLRANSEEREANSLIKVVRGDLLEPEPQFNIDESIAVLNSVSHVIDVENEDAIDRAFAHLAV